MSRRDERDGGVYASTSTTNSMCKCLNTIIKSGINISSTLINADVNMALVSALSRGARRAPCAVRARRNVSLLARQAGWRRPLVILQGCYALKYLYIITA